VANSNIVVPLEISYLLWRVLQLDYHVTLVVKELFGNFEVLSLFVFPFFVRAHLPSIRSVGLLQETSSFACHFVFQKVTYDFLETQSVRYTGQDPLVLPL